MPQVIWTVLPNGGSATTLKVSLYATLRFPTDAVDPTSSGTIGSNLAVDFATQVQSFAPLFLGFDTGTAAVPLTIDKSPLSPDLWRRLFPPSTPIAARNEPDMTARQLISFPTVDIHNRLKAQYGEVSATDGINPGRVPASDGLANFAELQAIAGPLNQFDGQVTDLRTLSHQDSFFQASRFYRRYMNTASPTTAPLPALPRPDKPLPDFHQALAMLADHPFLLRQLGLIIDGTFPLSAIPAGATLISLLSQPTGNDKSPTTKFTLNPFLAAPNGRPQSDLNAGFLALGNGRFDFQQMDIDGAAIKVGNYAIAQVAGETLNNGAPPSLRTVGIVIARNGRGAQMADRFAQSNSLTSDGPFFADDVLRGYRLDVQRASDGVWRSLALRHGTFIVGTDRVTVPAQGEIHDEGYVKASGATSDDGGSPTDPGHASRPLYVHEAILSWDGWSQVAPLPGKTIAFDYSAGPGQNAESVQQVDNTAQTAYAIEQHFRTEPGTLPKLRYGETYRLRARLVDLAGNSLPLSATAPDALVSPPILFGRHEPVPQPALVLRRPLVEGESVEHVVIRTQVGTPTNAVGVFFPTNDRFVAPPKASFDMALLHGKIDPFFPVPQAAYNLGLKSEGTLLDTSIWNTTLGVKVPVLGMQVINTPEAAGLPPVFPTNRGQALPPGQYVIHTEPVLALPYLPDPLAAGFAANLISSKQTTVYPFVGGWPDQVPAKLNLRTTLAAASSVVTELDGITAYVPPGQMESLFLSSTLTLNALSVLSVWSYMPAASQTSQAAAALLGQNFMLTPRRQVLVVNAVEKPLRAANFTSITATRNQSDTFALFAAVADAETRSTGQLDIEATWTDRVDRLADPGPTDEPHTAHVGSAQVNYPSPTYVTSFVFPSSGPTQPKHDFGDTRHRLVQYRPDATTRYREYFPKALTDVRSNIVATGTSTQVNIPSSARPKAPEVLYVVPTFQWNVTSNPGLLSATSTTSARVGRGLRVYLSRPWFSSGEGEMLAVVLKGTASVDDTTRKYISEWGADPAWATANSGPTAELDATAFTNGTPVTGTLAIAENPALALQAVAFPVVYDPNRQVWYADITMGNVASYMPFVRFAFARYQPSSVGGVELSPVVKAEYIQLVNDRTATLSFKGPLALSIAVTVRGVAGRNRLGNLITALPPGATPVAPSGYKFSRDAGAGRVVTAQVEQIQLTQSSVQWAPVGNPTVLPSFIATSSPGTEVLWSGTVPVAARPLLVSQRRLVIKEWELFESDGETADLTELVPIPAGKSVRGRIVYLDVIPFTDLDFI